MTRTNTYKYSHEQGITDDSGYSILQAISKICKICKHVNTHDGFACAGCGAPLYSIQRKEDEQVDTYNNQLVGFDGALIHANVYVIRKGKKVDKHIAYDESNGNSYIVEKEGGRLWIAIGDYDA